MTAAQASAALNPLFQDLRAEEFTQLHDQSAKARTAFVTNAHLNLEGGANGFSPLRNDVQTPLTIIMGMVLLVILMAVVNVASLLLVRAASRARSFPCALLWAQPAARCCASCWPKACCWVSPVRLSGWRWRRKPCGCSSAGCRPATTASMRFRRRWTGASWLFTIVATLVASLLFSLAPAAQFWNPKLAEALHQGRGGTGGSLSFRRTCVALQIGFSLLLIVAAGLFVRTIANLRNVNAGFTTDHLLVFDLDPSLAGYPATGVAPVEQRALDAIAALPGVRAAGATNDEDLADDGVSGDVLVAGYTPPPNEDYDVELPWVSDGYLQTLGVPLLAGRYFNAGDTATSSKVAIVNEIFREAFLRKRSSGAGTSREPSNAPATDAMIVGVVKDVKHASVRDPATPTCYTLFAQAERTTGLIFYVRTWQDPDTAANSIRAAIGNLDSKLIVGHLTTMSDEIDQNLMAERTIALLATAFGILATVLAGIGLYGILAYSTAQRTREIGIRMALGARRVTVVRLISGK